MAQFDKLTVNTAGIDFYVIYTQLFSTLKI